MSGPTAYGDPIVTGEAVAVEIRPAGIASRGIALVIDLAAQLAVTFLFLWLVTAVATSIESAGAAAVVLTVIIGIWVGYPIGFETLWRGRTPGKAVMGLRVVRDDGGPIRFRHAFVRGLVGFVLDRPGLSSGLLALVPMLVSARSKRLGDLAAGTIVVQDRVPTRGSAPPAMPPGLEAWARALDLSQVTDDLATEVRYFLGRGGQLAPWVRDEMGARLYAQVAARTAPPPGGVPPWAYLAAVLAERRRREVERLTPAGQPSPPSAVTSPTPPPPPSDPPSSPPGPFAPPR